MTSTTAATEQRFTIPRVYTAFQLVLEPLFASSGAALALVTPRSFLCSISTLTPSARLIPRPSCLASSPEPETFLLANLAACYGFFALISLLVLRRNPPTTAAGLKLWKEVLSAQLISDVGHLAALTMLGGPGAGKEWWAWTEWEIEAWTNVGILVLDVVLRCGFLMGLGIKEVRPRRTD